jgi:RimJ/RimL family protein N-acetyltransferase
VDLTLLEHQPTLVGRRVRLEALGPEHFEGLWPMFADVEGRNLTGTIALFTREQVRLGMAKARERHDRADWAVVALDGRVLGEVVLFELDEDSESMQFRIALVGPSAFGRGYGTEATRLVRDFAFEQLGLHRLFLEVFDHNPRARRVYEKCGFVVEGIRRDAQRIDGRWHDAIDMALIESDPRP